MDRDEFCAANRHNWDERVAIHRRDATGFYAIERCLAGKKPLHAIDSGELGEIAGRRLIHLQCHFGLDTLILARQGAVVTGLDFSPAALREALRGRVTNHHRFLLQLHVQHIDALDAALNAIDLY